MSICSSPVDGLNLSFNATDWDQMRPINVLDVGTEVDSKKTFFPRCTASPKCVNP